MCVDSTDPFAINKKAFSARTQSRTREEQHLAHVNTRFDLMLARWHVHSFTTPQHIHKANGYNSTLKTPDRPTITHARRVRERQPRAPVVALGSRPASTRAFKPAAARRRSCSACRFSRSDCSDGPLMRDILNFQCPKRGPTTTNRID